MEKVSGKLKNVIWTHPEKGVCIACYHGKNGDFTVTGSYLPAVKRATYIFDGEWIHSPKYGLQFKAASFEEHIGTDKDSIAEYLSSGKIKGIGKTKAITILASIELGLRVLETSKENTFYTSPEAVFEYFYPKLRLKNKECLYAMYLDVKGQLIKEQLITQGTINSSLMDGKDIFKWGVKLSASAIILVHNHPSGDPTPSLADLKATEKLIQMSKYVDMIILDHIIIGNDFYSMKRSSKLYKLF